MTRIVIGGHAFAMLRHHQAGVPVFKAFRQAPFQIPLSTQYTGASPCRDPYGMLPPAVSPDGRPADIAMGFRPWPDRTTAPVVCSIT